MDHFYLSTAKASDLKYVCMEWNFSKPSLALSHLQWKHMFVTFHKVSLIPEGMKGLSGFKPLLSYLRKNRSNGKKKTDRLWQSCAFVVATVGWIVLILGSGTFWLILRPRVSQKVIKTGPIFTRQTSSVLIGKDLEW